MIHYGSTTLTIMNKQKGIIDGGEILPCECISLSECEEMCMPNIFTQVTGSGKNGRCIRFFRIINEEASLCRY